MSSAAMGVCLLLVVSFCSVSVLALAPCDQEFIDKISSSRGCQYISSYQEIRGQRRATYMAVTEGDVPENTNCVTTKYQVGPSRDKTYSDVFFKNHTYASSTVTHTMMKDHILETDSKGDKYKLYVFHNKDQVYTYYKCIETGGSGNGHPMVVMAIGCNSVNWSGAVWTLNAAKICLRNLGVKMVTLNTCSCHDL